MVMMAFKRRARVWTALVLIAFVLSAFSGTATAAMVSTQAVVHNINDRAVVADFLQRSDVVTQLQAFGVSPDAAAARVNALTDVEVAQLAEQIGELPAGGTSILGVAVLIFLVLLLTDVLGYTDIFPFVKKPAK
jgi:hypothetical protein